MSEEQWRDVVGWEAFYEVSSEGRVRSKRRIAVARTGPRAYGGGFVRPVLGSRGYPVVNLSAAKRRRQVFLHKLVLEAFKGVRPDGMEACHNNGARTDCRLENLRWDTRSANHADKWQHGTQQVGERANNVKLSAETVIAIRRSGMSASQVARVFQTSKSNAKHILARVTWKHLDEHEDDRR